MTQAKKMAALLSTNATTQANLNCISHPRLEPKWSRILRALVNGSLNKFDAEKLGDHCLNTTACELHRDRGVNIQSDWEEVPAMGGLTMARVKRYWVARDVISIQHAKTLLGLA